MGVWQGEGAAIFSKFHKEPWDNEYAPGHRAREWQAEDDTDIKMSVLTQNC